jgi:hypothetical protein
MLLFTVHRPPPEITIPEFNRRRSKMSSFATTKSLPLLPTSFLNFLNFLLLNLIVLFWLGIGGSETIFSVVTVSAFLTPEDVVSQEVTLLKKDIELSERRIELLKKLKKKQEEVEG